MYISGRQVHMGAFLSLRPEESRISSGNGATEGSHL